LLGDESVEPWVAPVRVPIIECRHVTKWHGSFLALDDVSLTVERGDVAAVIGPSGAGKSTLLRCFNGLDFASSGDVLIDGKRLEDDPVRLARVRRRVGMVFQDFNLFPHLTVEMNVVIAQRLVLNRTRSEAIERAHLQLESVGMKGFAERFPGGLSGGEQQRVAIARALALDPDIVLMDEPTSSVDPEATQGIVQLMNSVARSGVTVVAVTHELGFVREVADVVFFFDGGRLLETGSASEVLGRPRNERTRRFLSDLEILWPDQQLGVERSPWAPPDSEASAGG